MALPPAATASTDRKCHNLDFESGLVGLAILCVVLAGGVQEGPTSRGSSYASIEGRPSPETEPPQPAHSTQNANRKEHLFVFDCDISKGVLCDAFAQVA